MINELLHAAGIIGSIVLIVILTVILICCLIFGSFLVKTMIDTLKKGVKKDGKEN